MASRALLWEAHNLAKTYRVRPSELYDIDDPMAAFCFDRAVARFGNALSAELEGVHEPKDKDGKKTEAKRLRILRKWIPETSAASANTGYRDPAKEA